MLGSILSWICYTCLGEEASSDAFSLAWGAAVDVVLAIYPAVYIVWGLQQTGWRGKLAFSVLMGLGILATVASVLVIYELYEAANTADATCTTAFLSKPLPRYWLT